MPELWTCIAAIIIASAICTVLVLAACMLSSQESRRQGQ
jgi:hypothetical protein